ncbi:N-acetylglucosamine-6-phosphate deacetylase [Segetibacter sp. 3557_3]|uniref:N-acetylglucosamine-6-phosphate deacetylase n=1 Tax=Segetibacter sp. 3557_3 TaxID=2547429 RepID=UPI001058A883|nr:N-acetylglucosamine-6-phosphate deacetylase [Segetibacter sp. 3557_3]TDH25119.1 N-acetylglucosamine-6-phosphate deacetylase [Segetibacter sp. 3557_3]
MPTAYSADILFTGDEWLHQHAVLVSNGIITDIIPTQFISPVFNVTHYGGSIMAPAFIDLQIYGGLGKLFSQDPSTETLKAMLAYCKTGGASYFLPTVATNTTEVFYRAIDAVRSYWREGGTGVLGLHIEGPWINRLKRGAHVAALVQIPTLKDVSALLEYGRDVIKMITLAPEVCSAEIIQLIQANDVIVSAGHSNATFAEATQAFDDGIFLATHLYNAMSQLQSREPGLVGAIMQHDAVMSSIIPDGQHVDFAVLSIAKKVMKERLFIITDAVTDTKDGPYPHQREGNKYVAAGTLSGSALTMAAGVKNCVEYADIELDEALRMASLYPAQVIGMQNQLGRLVKGAAADFVVLDSNLEVVLQKRD